MGCVSLCDLNSEGGSTMIEVEWSGVTIVDSAGVGEPPSCMVSRGY